MPIKTTPYQHQKEAFEFILKAFGVLEQRDKNEKLQKNFNASGDMRVVQKEIF